MDDRLAAALIGLLIQKEVITRAEIAAALRVRAVPRGAGSLAEQLDESEETVTQLRVDLTRESGVLYDGLSVTWNESVLLTALMDCDGVVPRAFLRDRFDLLSRRGNNLVHGDSFLGAILSTLRAKLRPLGITIETRHNGLAMTPENKARLRARDLFK
jgi:hypothetical protein